MNSLPQKFDFGREIFPDESLQLFAKMLFITVIVNKNDFIHKFFW